MTVKLPKRTRVSLFGVLAFFLFVFSGLFSGFLIAHLFPETVMEVTYGARTDQPARPPVPAITSEQTALGEQAELPSAPVAEPEPEKGTEDNIQKQPAVTLAALLEEKPPVPTPQFAVQKKPAPPIEQAAIIPTAVPSPFAVAGASPMNSIPLEKQTALGEWRLLTTPAGFVDQAVILRTKAPLSPTPTLLPDDVIELSGWTGDPVLGLRFAHVVFSLCGKIVGHSNVGSPRPDVAKAVHSNLGTSGWQAKLAAGHLRSCANAALQSWGVIPGNPALVPIGNAIRLTPPPAAARAAELPPGTTPFSPKSVAPLVMIDVDVIVDEAELRQCPRQECDVMGRAAKGPYRGYIADEAGDWSLVILLGQAGWVQRSEIGRYR